MAESPRNGKNSGDKGAPAPDGVARIRLSEEEARQGRILLRRPWQRWVFFVPLALIVIGGIAMSFVLALN